MGGDKICSMDTGSQSFSIMCFIIWVGLFPEHECIAGIDTPIPSVEFTHSNTIAIEV